MGRYTLLLAIVAGVSSAQVITRGAWLLIAPEVSVVSLALAGVAYYVVSIGCLWLMLRLGGFDR